MKNIFYLILFLILIILFSHIFKKENFKNVDKVKLEIKQTKKTELINIKKLENIINSKKFSNYKYSFKNRLLNLYSKLKRDNKCINNICENILEYDYVDFTKRRNINYESIAYIKKEIRKYITNKIFNKNIYVSLDISKCYCTIFYNLDKIFNLKNFNMSYDEYLNMIENIFDFIKNKYKIELRDTKVIFYGSLNKKLLKDDLPDIYLNFRKNVFNIIELSFDKLFEYEYFRNNLDRNEFIDIGEKKKFLMNYFEKLITYKIEEYLKNKNYQVDLIIFDCVCIRNLNNVVNIDEIANELKKFIKEEIDFDINFHLE
jgi:hypothetical protein